MKNYRNPRLYMMVGTCGTHKSETAKILSEKYNAVLISTDEIRKSIIESGCSGDYRSNGIVHRVAHRQLWDNISVGNDIVFDANNIKVGNRSKLFKAIKQSPYQYDVIAVVKTSDNIDMSKLKVPASVLEIQKSKFVMPKKSEGFKRIFINKIPNKFDDFILNYF